MVDLSRLFFWGLNLILPYKGLIGGSSGQVVGMVLADSISGSLALAFPVLPIRFQGTKHFYCDVLL